MTNTNELIIIEDQADKTRWELFKMNCPHLSEWGLGTLQSGLDAYAKTIVLEPRYVCKDHRNLHSHFYSKKFKERSSVCVRAHFFDRTGIKKSDLVDNLAGLKDNYIGYSVIRPVSVCCLGRTVIDPYKVGRNIANRFFVLRTKFKSHLNGPPLDACGYPYMSQDTEATVCAHTALWSTCRYLSERYTTYPETYPYDFIAGTTDTNGRKAPYRGMTYTDYSRLLIQFGCHPQILDMREPVPNSNPPATRLSVDQFTKLCTYVESGFPVLLSYRGHVVSVVGHTMDSAKNPTPNKNGWVDSSAFLKQLVVVDDNWFPYQLLGYQNDPDNYGEKTSKKYSLDGIRTAVCPLPEKVYLPSERARGQCEAMLKKLVATHPAEVMAGKAGPLVTRLFVTTSSALKRRKLEKGLKEGKVTDPFAVKIADMHLPHFVWVMEVSPLEIYRHGYCTTEIVLDTTANRMEECLLYERAGTKLFLNNKVIEHKNPGLNLSTFAQYTHNLGEL
jgi:hypothetical protein